MNEIKMLAGRHALVTGGSRGIGLAIVRALLKQGAKVTMAGRSETALVAACEQLNHPGLSWVGMDVADACQVEQAFERVVQGHGGVDILINNAGQAVSERFDRLDAQAWRQMMAVNLDGVFYCTQQALPAMLEQGWGRVVNVASTAGLTGYPYVTAYCAAKHGVVGLTRALAQEVARKGVTVNAVCPGYTETDIVLEAVQNIVQKTGMTPEQARARLAQRNPQGRLVQPDDVAQAVVWLCQPSASSVNGQALPVDGGEVMVG